MWKRRGGIVLLFWSEGMGGWCVTHVRSSANVCLLLRETHMSVCRLLRWNNLTTPLQSTVYTAVCVVRQSHSPYPHCLGSIEWKLLLEQRRENPFCSKKCRIGSLDEVFYLINKLLDDKKGQTAAESLMVFSSEKLGSSSSWWNAMQCPTFTFTLSRPRPDVRMSLWW